MRKYLSKESAVLSFQSLLKESDKGCVILVATMLEEQLRRFHEASIESRLYPAPKRFFQTLFESPGAPLPSFSGKIQIAYGYGLVSLDDFRDLETIRKLRNDAAHSVFDFSLEDKGIKNLVQTLSTARARNMTTPFWNEHKVSETKNHFILNGLALYMSVGDKLVLAVEQLLAKRKHDSD